jgi:hypothetical protein
MRCLSVGGGLPQQWIARIVTRLCHAAFCRAGSTQGRSIMSICPVRTADFKYQRSL